MAAAMRLLDRYLLRNFLVPFLLCFFGFLAIWLVFDLSDHASDFIDGKAGAKFIIEFYLMQLPQFGVIALPVGLLLALLYAMSRMSRSNEIISMLAAGQSLGRLLLPLLAVGLVVTGAATLLNYRMAPQAEVRKKQMLESLGKRRDRHHFLEAQLFRNRTQHRMWYVRKMPIKADDDSLLEDVHITQQNADGDITQKWYAEDARFTPATATTPPVWTLYKGKSVTLKPNGDVDTDDLWDKLEIKGWDETPWRIASTNVDAQGLSVRDLRAYLRNNADFPDTQLAPYRANLHYRWALPWTCFIIVLIAGPLGIVYSRRGVLAGVATAIFLFAANTFLNSLLLAFGKGSILPPFWAAWGANLLFAVIGLLILFLRSTNRELSSLFRVFGAK